MTSIVHRKKMSSSCSPQLLLVLLLLLRPPTLSFGWAPVSRTITVDKQGGGDFRTVQSAVDSVPDNNRAWVRIHVRKGSYREKVTIPKEKGHILLEGEGNMVTDINYDAHAHSAGGIGDLMRMGGPNANVTGGTSSPTFDSATFTVLADDFVARGISFKNMYNVFDKTNPDQAVAALIGGDRSAFYDCAFYGYQDTLCDYTGRHYFHNCFVKGAVDFIFGYAQSIYDGCVIFSNMPPSYGKNHYGWVTAHARQSADAPGGLVFRGGMIIGTGHQYLGRAWNEFATVVFYHVKMDGIVVPKGWDAWNVRDPGQTTFAEVGCTGPGADMAGRVPWEKSFSEQQVRAFVDNSFIDCDGWLSWQPKRG